MLWYVNHSLIKLLQKKKIADNSIVCLTYTSRSLWVPSQIFLRLKLIKNILKRLRDALHTYHSFRSCLKFDTAYFLIGSHRDPSSSSKMHSGKKGESLCPHAVLLCWKFDREQFEISFSKEPPLGGPSLSDFLYLSIKAFALQPHVPCTQLENQAVFSQLLLETHFVTLSNNVPFIKAY